MARLTRSESQARTRADLIATARDLFLADGYASTSLERVAEEAGYSKGAVYSNFRTKKELGLEVLELIHATKFQEVTDLLAAGDDFDERLERFQEWAEHTVGDVGWTMLEFEFATVARDDPALQAALVSSLSVLRGAVAAQVQTLADTIGIELPVPVEDAATGILSMGIGLGMQRAIDPSIPARLITDALRMLLTLGTGPLAAKSTATS
ncbi:putative TetR family transcriptional regulator [Nocardia brasiliensis NBRC 14402]|uniref:TetR/AcrR family transcriptional regulator n=1 Tax=Nocardia brasiliensis TaxID=37326 RepID=UPI0002D26997|nr:TetR/AcrR family transcriptional regulator [Nocardia brasiliensis]ASF09909.1 TetR/AcrR family transcriptional regulator [Nocardia brasiliensis]GAJ82022.1 putative TetR family transcriptional regulator [Nocardia brasiliensis NBRC 14402]SUB55003.1 Toluene efflux pump ttgABC operon repressor [Nocardia brasiliensis]